MSAPTPAPGDESPREGYYPDPSIPGYVRYWNGASWVPGTSRPAPPQGGTTPSTSPAAASGTAPPSPAPVDETGPMYFDEADAADMADGDAGEAPAASDRSRPVTAWQADTSRQTGFGGERDHRVSWGGQDPRTSGAPEPGTPPAASAPVPSARPPAASAPADGAPGGRASFDPRGSGAPDPARGALPATRDGDDEVTDGTATVRAMGPGASGLRRPSEPGPAPAEGTMTIRAVPPGGTPQPSAPALPPALPPAPSPALPQPQSPGLNTPPVPGSGGGSPSWPQQVHQLARPEQAVRPQPRPHQQSPVPAQQQGAGPEQQPVVPWKPPVDDPFQQLARAQASARPAGLGRRLAARLLDTVVLGALVGAAGFPLVTRAMDHIDQKIRAAKLSGETVTVWFLDSTTAGLFGGVLAAFLVLGFVLEAVPTAKWGRTLGKKLCGLEVRDIESHDVPHLGAALRRWLVYGVLGLIVVGVINVLWCLIDRPWRQCWHDKAARTFVAGR
ncbi:RDD family protein [Streptomyces sp. NPDC014623]|uniref:RDD family protein n=1 Tax=Streptomyces sp. NPDC014623 TaxID=3364875 RepID=UPI0036F7560B